MAATGNSSRTLLTNFTSEHLAEVQEQAQMALDALQRLQQALPENEEVDDKLEELTERNRELEAEVKSLKKQVAKLKTNGNSSGAVVNTTRRRTIGSRLGDSLVLHQASGGQMGEYEQSLEEYQEEDIEDDEYEHLSKIMKEYPIRADSLKRLRIKPRTPGDETRSPVAVLLESDQSRDLRFFKEGRLTTQHVTKLRVKLKFCLEPRKVLIIKKPKDEETKKILLSISKILKEHNVQVLVEQKTLSNELGGQVLENMQGCNSMDFHNHDIDFVICLGGDGTMIWTAKKFPRKIPPILAFSMGSLGFMAPFTHDMANEMVQKVLTEEMEVTVRTRIEVTVYKKNKFSEEKVKKYQVLNELVLDRGPNGALVNLEMFIGDKEKPLTSVQADGIIVATPTGSTAYSLASGGSMIHPAIPAMVVTPICPHTLSFRPVVVADSTYVRLRVPTHARFTAYASFDGKRRVELKHGEYVECRVSTFPVTAYCNQNENTDWFNAIKKSFHWNERLLQKKQ